MAQQNLNNSEDVLRSISDPASANAILASVFTTVNYSILNGLPSSLQGAQEILWEDKMLDRMPQIIFNPSNQQMNNIVKYFAQFTTRTEYNSDDVRLLCALISNIPDIFGLSSKEKFLKSVDGVPAEDWTSELGKLVPGEGALSSVDEKKKISNPPGREGDMTFVFNTAEFVNHLTDSTRQRAVLGMISLSLLRLSTMAAENVLPHVNGALYFQWGNLCATICPPKKLYFGLTQLQQLKFAINNNIDYVRRIVAMLIRKMIDRTRNPTSQLQASISYFLTVPICYNGYHLYRLIDLVAHKLSMEPGKLLEHLAQEGNNIIKSKINNYLKVMTYIRLGLNSDAVLADGRRFSTKHFGYARFFDGRCFVSISRIKNQELICFLIGAMNGDKDGAEQMWALKNFKEKSSYIAAGRSIYTSLSHMATEVPVTNPGTSGVSTTNLASMLDFGH